MRKIRNSFAVLAEWTAIVLLAACWANAIIATRTVAYIEDDPRQLPDVRAGLLLGTSRNLRSGAPNLYFFNRIDAAVELYKSGKIRCILVSGDNGTTDYNEPEDMRRELILRGIPARAIFLDYAGFRTLDSVLRAEKIFGQKRFIVISQRFHNERAIFLARKMGVQAYGFNAKDVEAYYGFKTKVREFFARVKVFVDLFFGVEPRFMGQKVNID